MGDRNKGFYILKIAQVPASMTTTVDDLLETFAKSFVQSWRGGAGDGAGGVHPRAACARPRRRDAEELENRASGREDTPAWPPIVTWRGFI